MESQASWTLHLAIGIIFCLSGYVISRNIKRWWFDKERLLPLHVWSISVSYNLLLFAILFKDARLWLNLIATVLGIYSLMVLTGFQLRKPISKRRT